MDASVLIVGSDEFRTFILNAIANADHLTVEIAPNPQEALPIIQAQQPDILVLQADQAEVLSLCQTIRKQSRLAWIYCVVVGDNARQANAADPLPTSDLELSSYPPDGALFDVTQALQQGADAYLRVSSPPTPSQRQLIWVQVQAGLRRVHSYRELIRTNDLLSAIALSDPLTELNNRRAFEWELPRQIQNARQRGIPISLLMLDVDYFKAINDNYGHLVGDRALKLISARLRHNLRFYDTPFRYGGEEFVIILNNTGPREAKRIGQRLCNLIANQPFTIDTTLDLPITVSAGTASLRQDDDDKGISLLQRADQHLLKAKSQGRNQVISAEDGRPEAEMAD